MLSNHKRLTAFLFLMSCVLLFSGCQSEVTLSAGSFPEESEDLTIVIKEEDLPLLDSFSALRRLDLSGSSCYEEIIAWAQAHPDVQVSYTVAMPNGSAVDGAAETLKLSDAGEAEEVLPLLSYLPELKSVDLDSDSAGLTPEQVQEFIEAYPEIDFSYSFSILGQTVNKATQSLNLSGGGHSEAQQVLRWLPLLTNVKTIDLGSEENEKHLEWDDISAIHEAYPEVELNYAFTLYGKHFTLADSAMDLNHITMDDEGALVLQVASCMPNLTWLDMDFCGVSNESMAAIRDALPNAEVVWRIWFGEKYSVRTNVEAILASNPGLGGELKPENTGALQYCTKVKYLDLGHNSWLGNIEFVRTMPDLEVLIVAISNWSDLSPLENCSKIEYLEIQNSALNDLRPLAGLKSLRHINIAYCFALHDLSPLYELTELERLWIGKLTPIPEEQIREMQRRAPDCEINTTTVDPTEEGWRYLGHDEFGVAIQAPRYDLLRAQLHYPHNIMDPPYVYYWNDPLYYPHP